MKLALNSKTDHSTRSAVWFIAAIGTFFSSEQISLFFLIHFVSQPLKMDQFEDGTPCSYRRSLLWDRIICKSVNKRNFQPIVIKMNKLIVSNLIMSRFNDGPDQMHSL